MQPDISLLCAALWARHKTDCSGFVRAVASALSVPLAGIADQIVTTIRNGGGWKVLANGVVAAQQADAGMFVVAGLLGSEQASPSQHGHVVVVVPGECNRGRYPRAFWGMLGGVGQQNQTLNYSWCAADRDKVTYAAHAIGSQP